MPEQRDNEATIERIDELSVVSLKVSRKSLDDAQQKMQLAPPLRAAGTELTSLWLGPDRWLLVSESKTADEMIRHCNESLGDVLHNAVDYSAGLAIFRIFGLYAGQILASGSGVDFRPAEFPMGTCCRTRLAQVAAVVVAKGNGQFDVYVDRSYRTYMNDWLGDASHIESLRAS